GRLRPGASIEGVAIQPMLKFAHQREVFVGLASDPVFGTTLTFGAGGVAIEAVRDAATALPPLNEQLARHLIGQTRVSRLLGTVRRMPAVDEQALVNLLLRVSYLACELPWIAEMDLNPVLAHPGGAVVVDARIVLDAEAPARPQRYRHLAIHPYPSALSTEVTLRNGMRLQLRPIRPEDAEMERRFVQNLSDRSRYFRFMHFMSELSPQLLARFTQIDYDREMALVAVAHDADGVPRIVGVSRYTPEPDGRSAEFAVTVADDFQGLGLGTIMLSRIAPIAREAGYARLVGAVLNQNRDMRQMVEALGFRPVADDDPETVLYEFKL
ncbi:MAG: GNAT family N-acetyltransferase, partial [Burkholderiales bacterium]